MSATRFSEGQRVRATTTTQGLRAGAVYTVSKVETRTTPFGTFATYTLDGGDDRRLRVINGHLLLEPAP